MRRRRRTCNSVEPVVALAFSRIIRKTEFPSTKPLGPRRHTVPCRTVSQAPCPDRDKNVFQPPSDQGPIDNSYRNNLCLVRTGCRALFLGCKICRFRDQDCVRSPAQVHYTQNRSPKLNAMALHCPGTTVTTDCPNPKDKSESNPQQSEPDGPSRCWLPLTSCLQAQPVPCRQESV